MSEQLNDQPVPDDRALGISGVNPATGLSEAQLVDGVSPVIGLVSPHEYSAKMLDKLASAAEVLADKAPGFLGMTAFGSTVRGEAKPGSDVDIFVLVDPDIPLEDDSGRVYDVAEGMQRIPGGVKFGTQNLGFEAGRGYEYEAEQALKSEGIDKADIIPLPMNERVLDECLADAFTVARQYEAGERDGSSVPMARNLRALFHVPIKADLLQPFIRQTLETLSARPEGGLVWEMIRHNVVNMERPKHQKHSNGVAHRYIPATLEEARAYYLQHHVDFL